ncbi:hypothetical protein [Paenibacillus sp. MBLB4367]|uniref:hypothetical protein n=1 Tax=Paenibacillus sp. MBLB4367 TaxID=3384767 RepID=UPI00390827FA
MAVFRKKGSKIGGIIALACLIIGFIFLGIVWIVNSNIAKQEIRNVIKAHGGEVLSIHKVKLEESTFLDTMESRKGKRKQYSNTFYKIKYLKNNRELVAWYRSVDGIFSVKGETTDFYDKPIEEKPENKGLIQDYGERWIFE